MYQERTLVGVPFYDGEGPRVLDICLRDLDKCLTNLNVDATIVVGINGPRVSKGQPPLSYMINKSTYNADIIFTKTPPGIVAAEKTICRIAQEQGFQRIFLTDADISRLPNALQHMWHEGDRKVVGANYAAYPPEILEAAGVRHTSGERALMEIFEADKHPLAREFTYPYRPAKRLKGSLLLVAPETGLMMFGSQGITSDSRMNDLIPCEDRQIVQEAAFMHYARICITDHIRARLRHFRAAAAECDLDQFTKKSLIYSQQTAEDIAEKIQAGKNPQNMNVASNFLQQCALRHHVAIICRKLASGKTIEPKDYSSNSKFDTSPAHTFLEASKRIMTLLGTVDWAHLDSSAANGKSVTQESERVPLELEPFLASGQHRQLILNYLGLSPDAQV